jgi:hypothetical protein
MPIDQNIPVSVSTYIKIISCQISTISLLISKEGSVSVGGYWVKSPKKKAIQNYWMAFLRELFMLISSRTHQKLS